MRNAFTLAETLIVLGIIGVVAALTMPTLIQNHQKLTTVTKLKETYSLLYQAIRRSEIDNGTMDNWNFGEAGCTGAGELTEKYIAPYIKVVQKCSCGDSSDECNFKFGNLNNPNVTSNSDYYLTRSEKLFLSNGTIVAISRPPGIDYSIILVDLNGKSKPNILGKDIFEFDMLEGKIEPRGSRLDRDTLLTTESGCHKDAVGAFCAALIMLDNWQITSDYPW